MIVFGFLVEERHRIDASDLSDILEDATSDDKWKWVLWKLNNAFYGIIYGDLETKGQFFQTDVVQLITLGEAMEAAEDARSEWIIPARSSGTSLHEHALNIIKGFIKSSYGMKNAIVDDTTAILPDKKKVKALVRRKPNIVIDKHNSKVVGVSTDTRDAVDKPKQKTDENGNVLIARKSRRNK